MLPLGDRAPSVDGIALFAEGGGRPGITFASDCPTLRMWNDVLVFPAHFVSFCSLLTRNSNRHMFYDDLSYPGAKNTPAKDVTLSRATLYEIVMIKSTPAGTFADRLRASREARDLSQSELARLTGLQPSAIAHFEAERRKPSFDNIRTLATALKVTTDYLLGSDGKSATAFRDEHKLSKSDRDRIQDIINLMVKDKK